MGRKNLAGRSRWINNLSSWDRHFSQQQEKETHLPLVTHLWYSHIHKIAVGLCQHKSVEKRHSSPKGKLREGQGLRTAWTLQLRGKRLASKVTWPQMEVRPSASPQNINIPSAYPSFSTKDSGEGGGEDILEGKSIIHNGQSRISSKIHFGFFPFLSGRGDLADFWKKKKRKVS